MTCTCEFQNESAEVTVTYKYEKCVDVVVPAITKRSVVLLHDLMTRLPVISDLWERKLNRLPAGAGGHTMKF